MINNKVVMKLNITYLGNRFLTFTPPATVPLHTQVAFYLDRCTPKHHARHLLSENSDLIASVAHKTVQELVCRQIKVGMMPHQQR